MVEFVIRDEQPFKAVEGAGFVNLLHGLQPRFKIPDRKKVARGVWDLYMLEKGKIKSVICDKRVSITTDTWTSIQNINYMVITAHFVDDSWNLHKRIINFTKITSHKGEDIGMCLERCLRDWGVEKVFSITVDNALANEGAVAHMKKKLERQGNLDGLGELEKAIEGIRNCVKYIHSSSARLDAFRNVAILENMDSMSNIPMDVPTRWNSTYKMLEGAFKYKVVFSRMNDEDVNFRAYFNEERFYDSTIKLSASKTPTSNLIFNEMVALQQLIEKKMHDWSNPILMKVARSMKTKFDKYWGQSNGGGNGHKINLIVFIANESTDEKFEMYKELEEIEINVNYTQLPTFPPTPSSVASTSSMSSTSMSLTSSMSLPPLPPPRPSTMDPMSRTNVRGVSSSTRGRGRGRGRGVIRGASK
ncbi:hypothetical protein QQ045_016792 [Rhodiola kirilowii]